MKKLMFTMVLMFMSTLANAQEAPDANFLKRLQESKMAEMALALNLTDEQKEKFVSLYQSYHNEMRTVFGERPKMKGDAPKGEKKKLTDAEKVQRMKSKMERQMKAQKIRLEYADKFGKILSDKQLLKFYDIEDNIQKKIRDRFHKAEPQGKMHPRDGQGGCPFPENPPCDNCPRGKQGKK